MFDFEVMYPTNYIEYGFNSIVLTELSAINKIVDGIVFHLNGYIETLFEALLLFLPSTAL